MVEEDNIQAKSSVLGRVGNCRTVWLAVLCISLVIVAGRFVYLWTLPYESGRDDEAIRNMMNSPEVKAKSEEFERFVDELDRKAEIEAQASNGNLAFRGTVETLKVAPLPQSAANWIVRFRIDKIVSGEFDGESFSFRIHSPAKSGLEIGKQYLVNAKRTNTGYFVDPYQWTR